MCRACEYRCANAYIFDRLLSVSCSADALRCSRPQYDDANYVPPALPIPKTLEAELDHDFTNKLQKALSELQSRVVPSILLKCHDVVWINALDDDGTGDDVTLATAD